LSKLGPRAAAVCFTFLRKNNNLLISSGAVNFLKRRSFQPSFFSSFRVSFLGTFRAILDTKTKAVDDNAATMTADTVNQQQEQKPRQGSHMNEPPVNCEDDSGGIKGDVRDDRSDDSTRHESPPSKLREVMDVINQLRYRCGSIVNNENVQFFIVLLIAINAIMMGVGTFDFVTENDEVDYIFEQIDRTFLVIFTIELGMQFIFHGWRLLLDGWLVFDLIVIAMSWSFSQAQIIRAFRIFRALRLITRIEVMKNLVLGKHAD
jgi:hypothetical protein